MKRRSRIWAWVFQAAGRASVEFLRWEQLGREQEKVVWLWCGKEDVRLER